MSKVYILELKPYVYEIVNGKRKRVSPLVMNGDTLVKIIPRGVVNKCMIEKPTSECHLTDDELDRVFEDDQK